MVLREPNDPLNQSRGIMGPLENSAVQNNRGRLRQRFDLIRKLGQGTYGKVQLGIDKETGQEVAIKTIKKSKIETEADLIRIRREIQIMSSVRHPNIIHIYEVFENREKMVLVMEYAAGGELYDYLNDRKILQEDEARRIFRQIASAVYYCHKHKICHRDLKLENILLDEKANAKIADFGLSNVFDDVNLLKTFCGSPLYASPEIVRGTPYYGPEVDCWSLGVLLYTLVYGAMPFDGSNFKRLVKQISNGDYYEPKKPAEASLLIRRMLTVDPLKRASIKDVCSHQWINQGFETPCLANAEELANQTPVRLDLLLSVAPAYNINHSQVVIACDQGQDQSQIDSEVPSTSGALAGAKPSTKSKKEKDLAQTAFNKNAEHVAGAVGGAVAPFEKPARSKVPHPPESTVPVKAAGAQKKEVKKKPTVKKKSKSSPVLELIVDVEEEEPMECIDGAGEEDDDDAGDTLSEISEIQTIAEDVKEVNKSKVKLKETEPKAAAIPEVSTKKETVQSKENDKEKKKVTAVSPAVVSTVQQQEKVKQKESVEQKEPAKEKIVESAPTTTNKTKPTVVGATTKVSATPTTTQSPAPITAAAATESTGEKLKTDTVKPKTKPATKSQDKPKDEVVPSKVTVEAKEKAEPATPAVVPPPKSKEEAKTQEKNKVEEESKEKPIVAEAPSSEPAVPPVKPPTVVKKKLVKKVKTAATTAVASDSDAGDKTNKALASSSSSIASSGGEKSGTKLDKGEISTATKMTPKLRARSDSNSSDASPTRIERRSSKVISQKTAELIQNLETKTSTSSTDSGKNKKLVFPSLKVSDAKRAFEKPPKPVKEPVSLSPQKSQVKNTTVAPTTTKTDVSKQPKPSDSTTTTAVKNEKEKEKPAEVTELTVAKTKKSKSKSPSPCPDNEKNGSSNNKTAKVEDGSGDAVEKQQTETTKTVSSKKSPNVQRKDDATSDKAVQEQKQSEATSQAVVEGKANGDNKKKTMTAVVGDKATPQKVATGVIVKEEKETEPSEVKVQQSTPSKPKSVPPKPELKEKKPTTTTNNKQLNVESTLSKPISPVPAAVKTALSPEPPMSPEPDTETTTQTVSDDLNTEIDMSMSEFSVSEVPTQAPQKSTISKPVKKLKLKINSADQSISDQLVKPVLVDTGHGPPKQAVMLVSGKTTPPVRSSHEMDSASISTDPFFSQSESVAMSLPKDNASVSGKKVIPQNKEQAVKKISSVISRIASSESNERLLNEDKGVKAKTGTGNKIIKTEVEKFVQSPEGGKVFKTQRSEVSFPVAAAQSQERIIPIKFAEDIVSPSTPPLQGQGNVLSSSSKTQSAPNIGSRVLPKMDSTKKVVADGSGGGSSSTVFSRQNSSDTESSIAPPPKPEPIRKSPREFIIPIKIETSGQTVTPKEDVAEATSTAEDPFRMDSRLRSGRFGRHKRYSSLLSDSSLEEEPASISASTSRRSSNTTAPTTPSHARSHSLGDQPDATTTEPTTPLGTFKRYRMRRAGAPLDRSDSFSSAEEDEEDAFEVLTAESLFSNLLDRVRNLTKRLNRDDGPTQNNNWPGPESPGFGLWGTSSPFREFMSRAPSETRSYVSSSGGPGSYTMTRSFSREPSVTVTISTGPGRRSLSREISGDSDSASVVDSISAPSRSGSVFQSRGSFGSGDNAETCTVRSLPVLGSNRRSQFLSQRSEPRGIPDKLFGRSGSCCNGQESSLESGSGVSSPLSIGTYNPPTARPYGRTMSNAEYSTSVTLPFRRSLKSYDRPSGYNFQNDYSSSQAAPDHHHSYLSSSSSTGGTTPHHYALPHRSNSVMSSSSSRYGSSAGGGSSSGGYGIGGTNSHYGSNLASDSQLNSPYSNRYSRSLSRARATPDPDISPSRFTRDVSTPRQIIDNIGDTPGGSSHLNSNNNTIGSSSSTRSSGESNGWVGGASSSSVKTAAAATAKMTTQEKMNNYANYYHNLTQHPTRRLHAPESPALANLRQSVDRDLQPNPAAAAQPMHSPMYDSHETMGLNNNFSPSAYRSSVGLHSNTGGVILGGASRELSSPPMLNHHHSRESTPSFTNNFNNNNNLVRPTSPPFVSSSNSSNSTTTTTTMPNCWPTVKTHRPVNVSNFLADGHGKVITTTSSAVPNLNMVHQSNNPGQFARLTSSPPQQHHLSSPPPQPMTMLTPAGVALESAENCLRSMSSDRDMVVMGGVNNFQQIPPKRDTRAAEKITCFLQRKSMSRELGSPPPVQAYQMTASIDNKAIHNNPLTNSESSSFQQQKNLQHNQEDERNVDRSYNGSPIQSKSTTTAAVPNSSSNNNTQKTSKPKFIQSLEKKWEKLTTGTGGSGSCVSSSSNNMMTSAAAGIKGSDECSGRKEKGSNINSVTNSKETHPVREQTNVDNNDDGDGVVMGKLDSESSLLQRAVSPEKKPKSKFGSSVNYMLGKFRRIEENSGAGHTSKIPPVGKPPVGVGSNPSRIGRRVQSVYAGACSDSVLTLSNHLGGRTTPISTIAASNCNGQDNCSSGDKRPEILSSSKSVIPGGGGQSVIGRKPHQLVSSVVAQVQDLPVLSSPEKCVNVHSNMVNNNGTEFMERRGETNETPMEESDETTKSMNKLRRPLSLGIFNNTNNSGNTSSSGSGNSSFIPRFTKKNVAAVSAAAAAEAAEGLKFPENVITTSGVSGNHNNHHSSTAEIVKEGAVSSPPEINVIAIDCKKPLPSPGDDIMDGNPLTPTSISDSFDSSSVCSEKTEMSLRSVLDNDGCESVSERIFRKSFYPRFNSLDRKTRSSSVSSSSPRHYSPKPGSSSGGNIVTTTSISSGGGGGKKMNRSSLSPCNNNIHNNVPNIMNATTLNSLNNCVGGPSGSSSGTTSNANNGSLNDSSVCINKYHPNKYNPNPLFKELITDEFKSDVGRKTEYSRRVTSKLSKLLREIESDIGNRNSGGGGSSGDSRKEKESMMSSSNLKSSQALSVSSSGINQMKSSSTPRGVHNRESVSPGPAKQNVDPQM